jgi:hypothetical protein
MTKRHKVKRFSFKDFHIFWRQQAWPSKSQSQCEASSLQASAPGTIFKTLPFPLQLTHGPNKLRVFVSVLVQSSLLGRFVRYEENEVL